MFYDKTKVPERYQGISDDHMRMMHYLEQYDDVNWIAIMPPHIDNNPSSEYCVEIGSSPGRVISKYDLGKFMIECLTKSEYYNQKCGLATKVPTSRKLNI